MQSDVWRSSAISVHRQGSHVMSGYADDSQVWLVKKGLRFSARAGVQSVYLNIASLDETSKRKRMRSLWAGQLKKTRTTHVHGVPREELR